MLIILKYGFAISPQHTHILPLAKVDCTGYIMGCRFTDVSSVYGQRTFITGLVKRKGCGFNTDFPFLACSTLFEPDFVSLM